MRHTTTAALTAALLLGLTACTAESSSPGLKPAAESPAAKAEKPAPADGTAELEAAVRAYSDAYFKPDAKAAHGMLSARCKGEMDAVVYAAVVENTVKEYGKHEIKTLSVDQISGDLARVSYTYAVPKLSQKQQPWAREDGEWRYDAC